jgi:hypothetical protein
MDFSNKGTTVGASATIKELEGQLQVNPFVCCSRDRWTINSLTSICRDGLCNCHVMYSSTTSTLPIAWMPYIRHSYLNRSPASVSLLLTLWSVVTKLAKYQPTSSDSAASNRLSPVSFIFKVLLLFSGRRMLPQQRLGNRKL